MKVGSADITIVASSVLIVIAFGLTTNTGIWWVGHAFAGIINLLFSIAAVTLGSMLVGRIRRTKGINLFTIHRKITIYLAILIVFSFFYGIWSRMTHGELLFWQHTDPLATFVHGWFGSAIAIMAVAQVLPCLVVKDRRKMRKTHMVLGYALLVSLVIQTFLGILAAFIEIAAYA